MDVLRASGCVNYHWAHQPLWAQHHARSPTSNGHFCSYRDPAVSAISLRSPSLWNAATSKIGNNTASETGGSLPGIRETPSCCRYAEPELTGLVRILLCGALPFSGREPMPVFRGDPTSTSSAYVAVPAALGFLLTAITWKRNSPTRGCALGTPESRTSEFVDLSFAKIHSGFNITFAYKTDPFFAYFFSIGPECQMCVKADHRRLMPWLMPKTIVRIETNPTLAASFGFELDAIVAARTPWLQFFRRHVGE